MKKKSLPNTPNEIAQSDISSVKYKCRVRAIQFITCDLLAKHKTSSI